MLRPRGSASRAAFSGLSTADRILCIVKSKIVKFETRSFTWGGSNVLPRGELGAVALGYSGIRVLWQARFPDPRISGAGGISTDCRQEPSKSLINPTMA
jgi:hypothetical protein